MDFENKEKNEEKKNFDKGIKKRIILEYLKEQKEVIPTNIVFRDVYRIDDSFNALEVSDLLVELNQQGKIERDDGIFGCNTKWAFISLNQS